MREIPMNATVTCADGKWGEPSHVIIDPVTLCVTHFVFVSRFIRHEL